MDIDKAIEILTLYSKGSDEIEPLDFDHAVLLGTEALIRERNNRINPGAYIGLLLPGETKE